MIILPRIPALMKRLATLPSNPKTLAKSLVSLPKQPAGRIALAITLSLLAHAVLLFSPMIELQPAEVPLPPLIAKLEPLPKIVATPAPIRKPQPKPQPAPTVPEAPAPADNQPDEPSAPAEPPQPEEPKQEQPVVADEVAPEARPAHPFPRHAQLTFIAYKGTDFQVGEARHRLDISDDNRYTLKVGMNTTGLASLFKTFELSQQSSGTVTASGLHPDEFIEARNTAKGKEALKADFDWKERNLSLSNGSNIQIPEQAQDILSFMYQLSQLPLDTGTIPLYISNGKKLERYELAVGEEEEIQTPLGKLRALPLRKIHAAGEEGLEIWLGLEYRLLPVKIRQIDRAGQIAGEMVISEIRVADE